MADRRRVVWLSVNSSFSHTSLALPLLHSACTRRRPELSWHEVECTPASPIAPRVEQIVAQRPAFLLATCYLFTRKTVLPICRRVKALLPETVVILGGPEFLGPNRKFLEREPAVDFLVRGEGEAVLPELMDRLLAGTAVDGIPGVSFRDRHGSVHDPATSSPELPFEQLPSPLHSPFFTIGRPFVQLEASRGCSSACAFCTSGRTGLRLGSLERLRDDISALRDRGVRQVRMLDRTFNSVPERTVKMLEMFRLRFPEMRFHIEVHPGLLLPDVRASLRQAPSGQLHIEAGIQSGDAAVLESVGRSAASQAAWDGVAFLAGCHNLEIHVDLLGGLPRQSLHSVYSDLARVISMEVDEVQLEIVKILPGTPLAATGRSQGIIFAPDTPYEILSTETMTPQDLGEVRNLAIMVDRFHNVRQLRTTFRNGAKADGTRFLQTLLRYVEHHGDLEQPMSLESRMKLLFGYAQEEQKTRVQEDVQYAWLRYGLSPQHGLATAACWTDPVPADALLLEGTLCDRATRIWYAVIGKKHLLFLFDRHQSKHPAYAVFSLGTG